MTDYNTMRDITIRLEDRRTTLSFNESKETHRKAWDGLVALRGQYPANSDGEIVRHAVILAAPESAYSTAGEGVNSMINALTTEWTRTEEPLSKAAVIRECLRRAGQEVEA